jgi:Bifunctional DNA primase/polymerase, N-terminal
MSENTGALPDDVLPLAHRLLALDLSVIPVPRPRPGVPAGQPGDGKVPAIAWRTYQKRRPTAREIDTWFGAVPMNLAVITGPVSGVVVVDADDPEALRWLVRRLPWTPWQTQTARGFHLWYRHPGVRVPNRARVDTGVGTLKIDVRGDGGYVIAPGSVHASGAPYRQAGVRRQLDCPVTTIGLADPWRARPTRVLLEIRPVAGLRLTWAGGWPCSVGPPSGSRQSFPMGDQRAGRSSARRARRYWRRAAPAIGPEAGHIKFENHRVMDEPVDGRRSRHLVLEDPFPLAEHEVAGDQHGPTFIPFREESEEDFGFVRGLLHVAEIINQERLHQIEFA